MIIATHRRLLEQFRHSMNLVGPGPIEPHFDDCLKGMSGLTPTGTWADLGSGAGFPGFAFASLYPTVTLHLVESRRKRALFLQMVASEAGTEQITVINDRIEKHTGVYQGAMARALAQPGQVLDYAKPLLSDGGKLVVLLSLATETPQRDGFEILSEFNYETSSGQQRKRVIFRRHFI